MKLSVIVPVYNTKEYLRRCLDSIINQTYDKIELIIIDDGSNDGSEIICDEYFHRYPNIKLIRTKNMGLVSARNAGVKVASGEYVTFVDSDDWIGNKLYEEVINNMQDKVDMLGFGCIIDLSSEMKKKSAGLELGIFEGDALTDIQRKMMYDPNLGAPAIFQSVWSKLFRRDILYNITKNIDTRITLGEDAAIVYNFVLHSKKIQLVNVFQYHYIIHKESMCQKNDPSKYLKVKFFYDYMSKLFKKYSCDLMLEVQLKKYLFHLIDIVNKGTFGIYQRPYYFLPWCYLYKKKIVLYCAGAVGKDYCEQLMHNNMIEEWIDN